MIPILLLAVAYLIGGIPFGYIFVRMKTGRDVRSMGSGNIGATNVMRTTGRAAGIFTLVLDVAKGFGAVWLMARFGSNSPWWLSAAALSVMAGHAYPVFLKFKGGKAVATFIGAFAYLTPVPLFAMLLVFVIVVAVSRHISLGSVIAGGTFPLAVWLILHPALPVFLAALAAGWFIVYRHRHNIERMRAGTEHVFHLSGKKVSALAILGAGSWGTALACALSPRFDRIGLWVHDPKLAATISESRTNPTYLPGFHLPNNVQADVNGAAVLEDAEIVLGVMPSRFARQVYSALLSNFRSSMCFVSATKGIEQGTLLRMSEVLRQSIQPQFDPEIAVLSGPTFAREIAQGDPAALVISSENEALSAMIQSRFSGPTFRLYRNRDPLGVEIGAALKNVIAIAAGICQGFGFGSNAMAALITRGLAEMTRLAVAMGGEPSTLSGLAGLGDLVLTCTGELSRNKSVGRELAKGRKLDYIVQSTKMIAEGVETTSAAIALANRHGVELPIAEQMGRILRGERSPAEALRELMDRSLKGE